MPLITRSQASKLQFQIINGGGEIFSKHIINEGSDKWGWKENVNLSRSYRSCILFANYLVRCSLRHLQSNDVVSSTKITVQIEKQKK